MGTATATCPRCGQGVTLDRAGVWDCPTCGQRNGERVWQKVGAAITGGSLVVTCVVLVAVLWTLLASCA